MKYVVKVAFCLGIVLACMFLTSHVAYAKTRGVVTGSTVNVRSSAEVNNYNRLFQASRGQEVYIWDVVGDFYLVNILYSYNVYIAREFVRVSETRGIVDYATAVIYDLPRSEGGQPIGYLYSNSAIAITSQFENWLGFTYMGEPAFVEIWYVVIPWFVELPRPHVPGLFSLAYEIVDMAMNYLGTRYLWGGTTPNGFDCSGFMLYLFRQFDISLNRVSRDQALNGVQVSRSDLQPADLVFFAATPGGSRIIHVGMYIGGGRFIHSSTHGVGVTISYMTSAWNNPRFVTARRVI